MFRNQIKHQCYFVKQQLLFVLCCFAASCCIQMKKHVSIEAGKIWNLLLMPLDREWPAACWFGFLRLEQECCCKPILKHWFPSSSSSHTGTEKANPLLPFTAIKLKSPGRKVDLVIPLKCITPNLYPMDVFQTNMIWQWTLQVQGADWVYQDGRRSCGAVGGQGGLPLAGPCLEAASDWPSSKEDSRWKKSKLIPTTAEHEQEWHHTRLICFLEAFLIPLIDPGRSLKGQW